MSNCDDKKDCTTTSGPVFSNDLQNAAKNDCSNSFPYGTNPSCPSSFDLTSQDYSYVDNYVSEHLSIGGAVLNVYKLLGVHEQGKLVDVTGKGNPISGGYVLNHEPINAFDVYQTEWRTVQTGPGVVESAYIGYDFGEIKLKNHMRNMYGIETSIFRHITAFNIKQSPQSQHRVTKVRVERSDDGIKWFGSGIADIPDNDCLNLIQIRSSAPARYWRLRPLAFNGGTTDYWAVQALELYHDYIATHVSNIQDKVFFENRDRDYSTDSIEIKGSYELVETPTELTKYMMSVPDQTFYFDVSFSTCINYLERPLIIGDIIELPSETQYTAELKPVKKWLEVTDVSWSTKGYTPGWKPTLLRVVAQPAMATQETQDLFGDLANVLSPSGLGSISNNNGGNDKPYQDFFDVTQTINAEAKTNTPENGGEASSVFRQWEQSEIDSARSQGLINLEQIGHPMNSIFIEDAMPPNNAPYTEGTTYPANPKNGDYHRLTYEGLSKDVPVRLYRYSTAKNRWVYMETDRRAEYNSPKKTIKEFLRSDSRRLDDDVAGNKEETR